jgi:hypothetical protein
MLLLAAMIIFEVDYSPYRQAINYNGLLLHCKFAGEDSDIDRLYCGTA